MGESLAVLQLSDLHLSERPGTRVQGVDADAGFNAAVDDALGRRRPDAILLTGDLSHDGSAASYQRIAGRLGTLGAPVLVLPGNHDDPATLRRVLSSEPFCTGPSVILGAWQLLLLDSTVRGETTGRLDAAALDALEGELHRGSTPNVLVCLHHPPVAIGTPWMDALGLQQPAPLLDCLACHPRVRGVVFGHIHQEYAGAIHGIPLLGSPATCCQFRPGTPDMQLDTLPPGYCWLDLGAGGALASRVRYAGSPASGPALAP